MSQKKSSHGNLRIRKFPVVRKYLRIHNFPVVRKKSYGSVSEAGEFGLRLGNQIGFQVQMEKKTFGQGKSRFEIILGTK